MCDLAAGGGRGASEHRRDADVYWWAGLDRGGSLRVLRAGGAGELRRRGSRPVAGCDRWGAMQTRWRERQQARILDGTAYLPHC